MINGRPLSAAELTLKGVQGDAGLYECRYADEYGSPIKRTVLVKLHDSNKEKTILIVSLVVVALAAVVIGLLWFYRSVYT